MCKWGAWQEHVLCSDCVLSSDFGWPAWYCFNCSHPIVLNLDFIACEHARKREKAKTPVTTLASLHSRIEELLSSSINPSAAGREKCEDSFETQRQLQNIKHDMHLSINKIRARFFSHGFFSHRFLKLCSLIFNFVLL